MDTMIIIDDILISEDILHKEFVCDLSQCKGGCCVEGDAGAPLEPHELDEVKKAFEIVKSEMSADALDVVSKEGTHTFDEDYTHVTPIIGTGICVYGYYDQTGTVKCLIEKAHSEGKLDFKKPMSCHLYPIVQSKTDAAVLLNYLPRPTLCAPACKLGEKLKVPVYAFLKEPLIRKFGKDFYDTLEEVALEYQKSFD